MGKITTPQRVMRGQLQQNLRARAHPRCVVCSSVHPHGLRQDFVLQADGSVRGALSTSNSFQGYAGLLHGGVTATLLDGAMTNCLFAHGVQAFTAELLVRYREPVSVGKPVLTSAWLVESRGRLHRLRAELIQDGRAKATALGKFMEMHE